MDELSLPVGIPPVYRGGQSVTFKAQDVKTDRRTGLLKTTHGISVDAEPGYVAHFGGAYLVQGIPEGLTIVQRGRRKSHYEIVPVFPMTPHAYQLLLDQVHLQPFIERP